MAVLLSALAAYVAARIVTHAHRHDQADRQAGLNRGEDLHAWMHDHLEISEEQWMRLEPFEQSYAKDRLRLRQAIEAGGLALAAAITRGDRGAPDIKAALDRINRAQAELQEVTLDHFFVMKEHLNPDQAEKLLHWTRESITRQDPN
jgi:Spy/CpxP family protein refolding chaperone